MWRKHKTGSFMIPGNWFWQRQEVGLYRVYFFLLFSLFLSLNIGDSLIFFFWWQYCYTEMKPFLPPTLCFWKTSTTETNVFYLSKVTCTCICDLQLREISWSPSPNNFLPNLSWLYRKGSSSISHDLLLVFFLICFLFNNFSMVQICIC